MLHVKEVSSHTHGELNGAGRTHQNMSIPIINSQEVTFAQCAEPLEQFAIWCGGTVVNFDGSPIAVTLPAGSTDAAVWPGEFVINNAGNFLRINEEELSDHVPGRIIDMLNKANGRTE